MEVGGGSVCHPVHIGNQLQLVSRLRLVEPLLGEEDRLLELRRHLMDFCLRMGLDRRRGGFVFAVPEIFPLTLQGKDLVVRRKLWWVQLEGLRSLLLLAALEPKGGTYRELALHQWQYLQRSYVDRRWGGFNYLGRDDIGTLRRPLARLGLPLHPLRKGEAWKDAFHETLCLIDCKTCLERHPELGGGR